MEKRLTDAEAAKLYRIHQAEHFVQGTPYAVPLTCDLDCPLRVTQEDEDAGEQS